MTCKYDRMVPGTRVRLLRSGGWRHLAGQIVTINGINVLRHPTFSLPGDAWCYYIKEPDYPAQIVSNR